MRIGRFTINKGKGPRNDYDDPPRPFLEHLFDLRSCLIHCALAWGFCEILILPFAPRIMHWLLAPAGSSKDMVQGLGWSSGIGMLLKIMLWGGTALSLPFLIFFIMRFVFPGLKKSERSIIMFCLLASTVLFAGGVFLAYSTTLEIAIQVLQQINEWVGVRVEIVRMEEHVDIVIKTIIAFGLAFQVPLLLLALGWMGIISSEALRTRRRIAIVVIFVMAMLLTPPDPISQILMAVPMCLLYEACIWIIRLRELAKKKSRDSAE